MSKRQSHSSNKTPIQGVERRGFPKGREDGIKNEWFWCSYFAKETAKTVFIPALAAVCSPLLKLSMMKAYMCSIEVNYPKSKFVECPIILTRGFQRVYDGDESIAHGSVINFETRLNKWGHPHCHCHTKIHMVSLFTSRRVQVIKWPFNPTPQY